MLAAHIRKLARGRDVSRIRVNANSLVSGQIGDAVPARSEEAEEEAKVEGPQYVTLPNGIKEYPDHYELPRGKSVYSFSPPAGYGPDEIIRDAKVGDTPEELEENGEWTDNSKVLAGDPEFFSRVGNEIEFEDWYDNESMYYRPQLNLEFIRPGENEPMAIKQYEGFWVENILFSLFLEHGGKAPTLRRIKKILPDWTIRRRYIIPKV